jgi:hypothetical protein
MIGWEQIYMMALVVFITAAAIGVGAGLTYLMGDERRG